MKVPVPVAVAHIPFESAVGCLGPQRHSEAAAIVGSCSYAHASTRIVSFDKDVDREHVDIVVDDKGLAVEEQNKQTR